MALTEQQIRQITDEIVRSLTKSMKEEAPAAPPQTDGCTGRWLSTLRRKRWPTPRPRKRSLPK